LNKETTLKRLPDTVLVECHQRGVEFCQEGIIFGKIVYCRLLFNQFEGGQKPPTGNNRG
jgi:hypothetical protein